jgi:hypothetical protein
MCRAASLDTRTCTRHTSDYMYRPTIDLHLKFKTQSLVTHLVALVTRLVALVIHLVALVTHPFMYVLACDMRACLHIDHVAELPG